MEENIDFKKSEPTCFYIGLFWQSVVLICLCDIFFTFYTLFFRPTVTLQILQVLTLKIFFLCFKNGTLISLNDFNNIYYPINFFINLFRFRSFYFYDKVLW